MKLTIRKNRVTGIWRVRLPSGITIAAGAWDYCIQYVDKINEKRKP